MSFDNSVDRHLKTEGLREYLDAGAMAIVPIAGQPTGYLVIDPVSQRLAMRFAADDEVVTDVSAFRHISARAVVQDGQRWAELSIEGGGAVLEAYPILCALADRIQLQGSPFDLAVNDVLSTYRHLLEGLGRLSDNEEIGLFGELLLLQHLIDHLGDVPAISAWRGPQGEEHDFDIGDSDVEVKTTMSENRRHWINGLSQLEPTTTRPLWLLSIQVTTAGASGSSLPSLISEVRQSISTPAVRIAFDQVLTSCRWNDAQAALYSKNLRLRTSPAAFRVKSGFPAITPTTLKAANLPVAQFGQVSYQIDLSGESADVGAPVEIDSFCQQGSHSERRTD